MREKAQAKNLKKKTETEAEAPAEKLLMDATELFHCQSVDQNYAKIVDQFSCKT